MSFAIFTLPFMIRALIGAVITGLTAPCIGSYIVQRRLSLLGDGLGHLAIAGVGIGLATGTAPLPVALVICVMGAIAVEMMRSSGKAAADVGLAILFYGGLAVGIALSNVSGQGTGALMQYLFGSLLTISPNDLVTIVILGSIIVAITLGLARHLFAICADEDYAKTLGLPVWLLNILMTTLAAVTIALSMRTVGLLLISALMVIPVATAKNLVIGFRKSILLAMAIGCLAAVIGVLGSYYLAMPAGALIVLTTIVVFLVSAALSPLLMRRIQRTELPVLADPHPHTVAGHGNSHPHKHGPDCGHLAVRHGDHIDYIHDGHRHAPHGEHYDEH